MCGATRPPESVEANQSIPLAIGIAKLGRGTVTLSVIALSVAGVNDGGGGGVGCCGGGGSLSGSSDIQSVPPLPPLETLSGNSDVQSVPFIY